MRSSSPLFALAAAVAAAATAGCGDDGPGAGDPDAPAVSTCNPPASSPLPTAGELISPADLPLPGNCVAGGLRDLPGRWFIADLTSLFNFSYPKFEGTCET